MRQQISHARLRHLVYALFLFFSCGLATAKAQTTQPLTPFLDEVTVNPTTGLATAYFGYNNPNTNVVSIRVGQPRNFMFQAPEDRGQPELFLPGVHHYAFAAVFSYQSQSNLTWILDNGQANASSASAMPQPQNSIFTYQGRLTDGATAASGNYQMLFALYDAANEGTQIGSTQTNTNVNVSNGLFNVQLDFGSSPFTGADRYLEIGVKRPADAAYTTLAPRQQLTASPFAIHTIRASSADALSNGCVGCITSAQIGSVDGSKVSGNVANADNATVAITAGNVTGIVGVANGGTGSATQNFVDLSTNQSSIGGNKTFTGIVSGTFTGDGSGLSNVAGKFLWQVVAGTSLQALANTGYVITNANPVTINLPTAPNVGDIVRVSGAGTGGWRITQNSGQTILGANLNLYGASWTAQESNRNWLSVASSADGSKLVAGVVGGRIYTSTDSGANWAARESERDWSGVASSADGTKLAATVNGGKIYTSTDSGVNWTERQNPANWTGVASSANGTKLVAVRHLGSSNGAIFASTDSGVTWTQVKAIIGRWTGVASSADGTKLVAVGGGHEIFTSTNSGGTWNPVESPRAWVAVASSADGTKLVAVVAGGQIYTSTDSGVTWEARESNRNWAGVASSADGIRLVATVSDGKIYTSTDSGVNWMARESTRTWSGVASSADGTKLAALVYQGRVYTSSVITTVGMIGGLVGEPFAAIELQYLGGGQFLPLSHEGAITGN